VYRRDVSDIMSDDHSRAWLAAAVIISLVPLADEESAGGDLPTESTES
jgi:hypothetical protein